MTDASNLTRSQARTRRTSLRRWGRWLLLLAILLALLGSISRFWPKSLLERSTRLVSLKGVASGQRDTLTPVWMDEHELLLLRYPDADSVQAERLDVTTGARSPAPDVERVLHPTNAIPLFSPDGKWLLMTAQSAEKETMDRLLWIARPLKGDDETSWFPADPKAFSKDDYHVDWLPDSRHVAEFLPYSQYGRNVPLGPLRVHIHDVQTGEEATLTFPIPAYIGSSGARKFDTFLLPGNRPLLLRMDPSTADGAYGWQSVTFYVWENMLPGTPPRTWKVVSPPEYSGAAVKISPDGKRIAWVFVRVGLSPLQSLLNRIHPAPNALPECHLRVAVSSLDGSRMRSLGELTLSKSDAKNGEQPWEGLQWVPGAKRLSYTYHEVLYTLPAD
jgi:hypothetical protein